MCGCLLCHRKDKRVKNQKKKKKMQAIPYSIHCGFTVHNTNISILNQFKSNSSSIQPPLKIKFNVTLHHNHNSFISKKSLSPLSRPSKRDVWKFKLWSCCNNNIPRKWGSWVISIYLCCLSFVAEAHDYYYSDQSTSITYACEDVESYYGHLDLKAEALQRKLNSIITNHRSLSYKEVWDALKILDAADVDKPEASSAIVEIYSLRVVPKSLAGKPEGWNREHLWPRSYGLTRGPSLTDLHNIHPADVNVNSSRGNKYYGECLVKSTKCLKPANKEAAPDTETDKESWTPPLQVRGDIARALMYMAVCYGFHQPGAGPDLRLSDTPSTENATMGLISTLLRWNEIDPPSREEKLRNERICRVYQHNRNPFIDYPEYANLIWRQAGMLNPKGI